MTIDTVVIISDDIATQLAENYTTEQVNQLLDETMPIYFAGEVDDWFSAEEEQTVFNLLNFANADRSKSITDEGLFPPVAPGIPTEVSKAFNLLDRAKAESFARSLERLPEGFSDEGKDIKLARKYGMWLSDRMIIPETNERDVRHTPGVDHVYWDDEKSRAARFVSKPPLMDTIVLHAPHGTVMMSRSGNNVVLWRGTRRMLDKLDDYPENLTLVGYVLMGATIDREVIG